MRIWLCAVAMQCIAATPAHATRAEYDAAMLKLATDSGCMACHSILPTVRRADAMPPHAVVVKQADARALVNWILVLVP